MIDYCNIWRKRQEAWPRLVEPLGKLCLQFDLPLTQERDYITITRRNVGALYLNLAYYIVVRMNVCNKSTCSNLALPGQVS